MPLLCAFGCKPTVTPTHRFPDYVKFPDRFKLWVTLCGGELDSASDYEFFKKKIVCDRHFTDKDHNRYKRLNTLAIPSLFVSGTPAPSNVAEVADNASLHQLSIKGTSSYVAETANQASLHQLSMKSTPKCDNLISSNVAEMTDRPSEASPRQLSMKGVKTSIIYPATEKHIAKFIQQVVHIVQETPQLYETLTLPHIEKEQFTLQWVYNILEGKSEQDRIIHNNKCQKEGFLLLPDLKWDGVTKETLYLLAIVRQRGIRSLRDLEASHLPLLRRVRDEGKEKILEKYNVPGSQLRIYLHYQPSFYHLHVHFTYLRHEAPGIYAERAHLLDTVINNIEIMGDYYKKSTLPFTIREMDNIFNLYETNGHVQRIKNIT